MRPGAERALAAGKILREDVPPETLAGSLGCGECPQDGGCIRLDDESGLSRGGNRKSGITGITPPAGHPPGIWEELVRLGKLKRDMSDTYRLPDGPS